VLNASTQKAARKALCSLNWPPEQTKEHKYEYTSEGETNNNMCSASENADTNQ